MKAHQQELHALRLCGFAQVGEHGGGVFGEVLRRNIPAGTGGAQHHAVTRQLRSQTDAALVVAAGSLTLFACGGGKGAAVAGRCQNRHLHTRLPQRGLQRAGIGVIPIATEKMRNLRYKIQPVESQTLHGLQEVRQRVPAVLPI